MKNLVKIFPLILFPIFNSIDSKAQSKEYFLRDTIPFEKVPDRFKDYQNNKDVDTLLIDTSQNIYNGIVSQVLYLDINKDSFTDVREFKGVGVMRDSTLIDKKTIFPWKYHFFEEEDSNGLATYRIWYDFFMDGIDGNESSQNILREQNLKDFKKESNDPLNSKYWPEVYEPNRKVDI